MSGRESLRTITFYVNAVTIIAQCTHSLLDIAHLLPSGQVRFGSDSAWNWDHIRTIDEVGSSLTDKCHLRESGSESGLQLGLVGYAGFSRGTKTED